MVSISQRRRYKPTRKRMRRSKERPDSDFVAIRTQSSRLIRLGLLTLVTLCAFHFPDQQIIHKQFAPGTDLDGLFGFESGQPTVGSAVRTTRAHWATYRVNDGLRLD